MKKFLRETWPFLILVPFVAAAVAGWFLLPAELATGTGTVPKAAGLLLPIVFSSLGASQACKGSAGRRGVGWVLVALAAVMEVMLFAGNL